MSDPGSCDPLLRSIPFKLQLPFVYRKPLLTRRSFSGGGYDA